MPSAPDSTALAALLPGTWAVAASNMPKWLSGERINPTFTYEALDTEPLQFAEVVDYSEPDGTAKQVVGTDTWHHDRFVWRGKKWLRFAPTHWSVTGASEDGTIAVIRFSKSLSSHAGLDIIVRQGTDHPELRRTIAHESEAYGLSREDFASLSWLQPAAS